MSIQVLIIVAYFVLTVVIGMISSRRTKGAEAFHGAGLGVLMCVSAGAGEWLGGTSTTGVSEYGYTFGISGAWYTIANGIGVMFLALFFAKLYRSLNTVTVPGILEAYIGSSARRVASVMLIFVMIMVGISQVIAAGTLGVSVLGLEYNISVIVLGIVFIVYTLAGGMNAVAATNVMHLVAMYGGVILALVLVRMGPGAGIGSLRTALPASFFGWFSIGTPKVSSWIIASLLGACTAQAGIQPILAAKDVATAKKSAIITALLVAPFGILTALLGMYAKVIYPNLSSGKLALPTLMMDLHPVAGGIVLASIMAAILSTVSPIILAVGTMFTKDLYEPVLSKSYDATRSLFVSRAATAAAGIVCIIFAIFMFDSAMILDMVYFAYTLRGSLFIILLLAIFLKKRNEKAAIWSMILTAVVSIGWLAAKGITGAYPIPALTETYMAVLTALVSGLAFNAIFRDDEPKPEI